MSFFITSVGKGDGANLGAGRRGRALSDAWRGGGRTGVVWHAYMSTQGPNAVNARDRIGNGPWFNARGQRVAMNVAELHGDTIELARIGNALGKQISLNEKARSPTASATCRTQHDMLTGSSRTAARTPTATTTPAATGRATSTSKRPHAVPLPPRAPHLRRRRRASRRRCTRPSRRTAGPLARLGHSDKQGGNNGSWNSSHGSRGCSQPIWCATGGAGLFYCFAVN